PSSSGRATSLRARPILPCSPGRRKHSPPGTSEAGGAVRRRLFYPRRSLRRSTGPERSARPYDPRAGGEVVKGSLVPLEEGPHPDKAEREAADHENDGGDEGGPPPDAAPPDLAALDDREAKERLTRRAPAPCPSTRDVERVREHGEKERKCLDASKRPVGGRIACLELRAEVIDEKDGREEKEIDGREDDGIDERREEARERIRRVPRALVDRLGAPLTESGRAPERRAARRGLGRTHLDRDVRQPARRDFRGDGRNERGGAFGRGDGRDLVLVQRPASGRKRLAQTRARPRRRPLPVDFSKQLQGRHLVRHNGRGRRGGNDRVREVGDRLIRDARGSTRRHILRPIRRLRWKLVGTQVRRAIRRHARRNDSEVDDRRPELDAVPVLEPRLARDPLSSHVRAVRGVEILHDGLTLIQREKRVRARDGLVLEAHGRGPAAAQRRLAVQKLYLAALRREHVPKDIICHRDGHCIRPRSASAVGVPPRTARAAGRPENTTRPPAGPPPGPSSIRVSARARNPILCSTATIEWPEARRRRKTARSTSTSDGASPVVGSSKMNRTGSSGPPPRRKEAIFNRCASPPESVPVGWPSVR